MHASSSTRWEADVYEIDGLSPAISIDQKGASRNPRSTVGTVTEIYDHLRLLFARIGIPHCPNGHPIERQSVQQIVDQVLTLPMGTRLLVLAPLIKDRKTEGDRIFEAARRQGFVDRVDGETYDIEDAKLGKYKRHSIEVVVDLPVMPTRPRARRAGRTADRRRPGRHPGPGRRPAGHSIGTAVRLGGKVLITAPPVEASRPVSRARYAKWLRLTGSRSTSSSRATSPSTPRRCLPACTGLGTLPRSTGPSSRTVPKASRKARSCRGPRCRPTRRGG
jgi:excinuclease ABC subunit A